MSPARIVLPLLALAATVARAQKTDPQLPRPPVLPSAAEVRAVVEPLGPGDTPNCAAAIALPCDTATTGNTIGQPDTTDVYGGVPGTYQGGELVYAITLATPQNLDIYLSNHPGRAQYLFLLQANLCDAALVIQGGKQEIHYDNAAPATYYLVVDGRTPADNGSFDLRLGCNTPATASCAVPYTVTDPATYSWLDATTGTAWTLGDNVNTGLIPLPFPFDFFGTTYNTVAICSNGWASFTSTSTAAVNAFIPNTGQPNALVAPLWDDLVTPVAYTQTFGVAPNRRFVIEWYQVYRGSPANPRNTFEVVLYEDTRDIRFQYEQMDAGPGTSTIGIENPAGTAGYLSYFNQNPSLDDRAILYARNPSLICTGATPAPCNATTPGDTSAAGLANRAYAYNCGTDAYMGNEQVFSITVATNQIVDISISNFGTRDLDVFLLNSCDSCACRSGGQDQVTAALTPGTYYVVVDGFTAADNGPFDLTVTCGTCSDPGQHQRWSVCERPRSPITYSTTSAFAWYLDDCDYCRDAGNPCFQQPCTFDMYIMAECGAEMHLPLYDNETANLQIYDMLQGQYVYLYAQSTGGWSAQGFNIQWQDCSGTDPRWNNQTTDIWFEGNPTVCGIYRAEFVNWGGFIWDLFSNCSGTNSPGFKVFDNYCEALEAYDPYPQLSVESVTVSGLCPNYQVAYEISNAGCLPATTTIVANSDLGGFAQKVETDILPGQTRMGSVTLNVQSAGPGTIYVYADLYDQVLECTEAGGNATGCSISGGGPSMTAPVNCPCIVPDFQDSDIQDTCAGLRVFWDPAVFPVGPGHYDVYRSTISFADAVAQPPVATFLTVTEYVDLTVTPGTTYYYVVRAEDVPTSNRQCFLGPHGGLYVDLNTGPIVDQAYPPIATAANTGPYCEGATIQLLGGPSGMTSYSWTGPAGFTSSVKDPTISGATVANAGAYSLTVSNFGCLGNASTNVVVNPNPAPAVTGPAAICKGVTATLDAGAGYASYLWSTGETTQTISVTPVVTSTYTVTVTDGNGCSASDSHTVTVNLLPAPAITGPSAVCLGGSVTLDAGAGYASYLWSTGETTQTISVAPVATATYNVTVVDGNGCDGSDAHTVTVNANPTPTITGPTAVCAGGSVTLDAGAGYAGYLWSTGATTQTISVTPAATATYSVTVTDGNGCNGVDSHTVTVNANPAPAITGPTAVCAGGSVTLDAGAGYASYLWSTGATTQTISVTPAATATYSVTVTDGNGCSGVDSHTVTVNANPTPAITGPTAVCAGGSVTLDAGSGYAGYLWSTGATTQTITVTPAATATYSVTVTDGNGCSGVDSHTVTVNALPTPAITGPTAVCAGGSVTLDAGAGYPSYLWSTGATTQTISVTPAATATYSVTVTDGNGCSGVDSHTVTVNANPTPAITGPTAVCAGGSVTLDAGAGFAGYLWSTGATTQTISVTPAATATYSVTVTDGNGCSGVDSHTVTVNALPTPAITGPTAVCAGGSVTLDAGAGYAGYLWSTGATTQTISVTPAATATYSVTVTDTNGCSGVDSHTVTVNPNPTPGITGPTAVCAGGLVTLDAGAGYSSYLWSTGATTQTISVTPAATATYSVTVTDGNGCSGVDSHTVTVNANPTPAISGPNSVCAGGSVTLDAGSGYASYLWSTGATTQTITESPVATTTYSVTVTDGNGCSGVDSHTVTLSPNLTPVITGPTAVCAGGSVTLDAGAGFASYLWSTGATTQTISVTPAATATYSVTVTDVNGCSGADSHTVTVNPLPTPAITGPTAVCAGGSVTLDAGSGYAGYLWSTGATTQTIAVSPAATTTYSVTVTDGNGCSGVDSHTVTVNPNPTPAITGPSAVCAGGSVTLDAGSGYAGYLWSTGATTQTITVSPAATTTYSVTVTDGNGCSGVDSHTVTLNPNLTPTITGPTAVCAGGSVTLDAGSGYAGYLWSTGATTQTITVSPAATATYSVTVTDGNGCSGVDSHTVTVNALPTPAITGPTAVCAGGSVTLDAGAGYPSYLWSTGATTQTISVTPAATATYSVTVTDGNGCSGVDSHTVTVNPNPTPAITGPTAVCAGGSVTLDAGSGYASYLWSTGATTQTITVSPAATTTYSVTVTDGNGCSGVDSHTVTLSPNLTPTITGPTAVCAGGSVTLDAGAGYASYLWSTGATTQTISVTPAGTATYSVTVTDTNGCSGADSHTVTVNALPTPAITGPAAVCAGGSVTLDAGAGYPGYLWSTGETTQTISVTPAATATYSVTVTDGNGCSGVDSHTVTVNPNPTPAISGPSAVCAGGSVTLDAGSGYAGYLWSTGATTQTITVTPVATTTYSVTVTDGNGCSGVDSHTVTLNPNLTPTITGPTAVCAGGSVTLDAGAGYASYLWSTGATTQTISVTPAGTATYSVTVTDTNGCSGADSHTVTVNALPTPAITGPAAVCAGGSVTLDAGAGYAGYLWSTGATTQTISVTPAATATYSVTVTDGNGCDGTDSHTVTVNPNPTPAISGPVSICTGGSATLDAGAGYASYLWSTGATTQTITVSPAATTTYTVTVTDGNGCTGSDGHTVTVNPGLSPSITGPAAICVGQSALLDAGAGYTSYLWSTGATTRTITVSPGTSTTYSVTVSDANGCAGSDTHDVTVYGVPVASAGADKALTCTTTTVTLDGAASGGSGSFTYLWTPATGLSDPTVARPTTSTTGTWTLTVTDTVTGCTSSDSVSVILNNVPPTVSAGPDRLLDCQTSQVQLDGATSAVRFTFFWNPTTGLLNPNSIRPFCNQAGVYTLTVTDLDTGCVNQDSVQVTQNFQPPTSSFTQSASTVCVNAPICFTSGATNYLTLLWDFGTGNDYSSLPNPCFAWTSPGDYTVRLTATNNCGSATSSTIVTILPTPVSSFTYAGQGGKLCKGNPINFTDTSTNNPTSWSWNFGDPGSGANNTSTLQNPSHTYVLDGVYIVTLTASNACGTGTTAQQVITIVASCQTNCSANSNQISCTNGLPQTITGNTLTDFDNTNTSYYGCKPDIIYGGPNKTYDLNYNAGATYRIRLVETVPEPNNYDLDIMMSDNCNPYNCVAWGDSEIYFNDRAGQDYFLIVDGRNASGGPYQLEVTCWNPAQTASCTAPTFAGILDAQDNDPCAISGILVTWGPASSWGNDNAGAPCAGGTYEVLRAPSSSPTSFITIASGLTGLSFVDLSVAPNVSYVYKVNAINGCCGKAALTLATDTAADLVSAPPTFGGITSATDVDACAKSGIMVQWNPVTNWGSSTGTYRVKRSPYVDCSSPLTVASGLTTTSFLDTTALANTNYYYRVEAVSQCGVSSDGGTGCLLARDVQGIGAEPSARDLNPTVPPLLATRVVGTNEVSMTWEANSSLYNLYRGSLASLQLADYDHQQIGACNLGSASATVDPGLGDFYYIVTGKPCLLGQESSYGRNSIGQERPNAAVASGNPCP